MPPKKSKTKKLKKKKTIKAKAAGMDDQSEDDFAYQPEEVDTTPVVEPFYPQMTNDYYDMSTVNILSAQHPNRQTNLSILQKYDPTEPFKSRHKSVCKYQSYPS